MSYCTKAQVKAMFRNLENSTDPAVTDASLDEFIAEADSSINARLKGVYVLPITEGTNPESFVILRKICRLLVACVVDNILNTYAEADKKPDYCKQAHNLLDEIAPKVDPKTGKRPMPASILPDATFIGMNTLKDTVAVQAVDGRIFQKGVDSW
ncbi:MAG: hypothetical protein HC841_03325 [Verrucomicrobiae bacterium]|nr:hypothetical protein [Verrucomicrobiae bacterium]